VIRGVFLAGLLVLCACADVRARPPLDDDDGVVVRTRVEVFARGCAASEAGGSSLTIPGVTAGAGSTIAVSVVLNRWQPSFFPTITWGALTATPAGASVVSGSGHNAVVAAWVFENVAGGTHDVVLTFATLAPPVQVACVSEVRGLTADPFDGSSVPSSNSDVAGDPSVTATVSHPIDLFWVELITMGPEGDAAGTWASDAAGLKTGQRKGTTGLVPADSNRTLSEAWQVSTTNRSISKSGLTERAWGMIVNDFAARTPSYVP
jgi:hypothetical protein